MVSPSFWAFVLGPVALVAAAVAPVPQGRRQPLVVRLALAACFLTLGIAIVAAVNVAVHGVVATGTSGIHGIGFGLYLDSLSAAMFCLVSFVGLIVVNYSRNYMEGDPGQDRFTRLLCITLAAVLLIVISGNLFQLVLAWIGTSLGLQELLLFYPERRAAALAGRKKFIFSRIGEISLIGAAVVIERAFGTLDYATVFSAAANLRAAADPTSLAVHVAAALVVVAALLKSAQFPTHGWLTEVMETPTPVSALLHAGIVNAGGFLVLRFSALVSLSLPSLETLAIVGGFTALFGSVVMLAQTSIKVTLAFSTVAQMGFMMLECGFAAFPAALLHIIAHSLYKAHAFLSSGSILDIARASWSPSPGGRPHRRRQLFAVVGVLAIAAVLGRVFAASPIEQPGVFVLAAVLLLGLMHLISSGIDERLTAYVVVRTLLAAVFVGTTYFALQLGMQRLFAGSLPTAEALRGPFALAVEAIIVIAFALVTYLQGLVRGDGGSTAWQRIYSYIANGLYVNTYFNRLVLRFWRLRETPAGGPVAETSLR